MGIEKYKFIFFSFFFTYVFEIIDLKYTWGKKNSHQPLNTFVTFDEQADFPMMSKLSKFFAVT